MSGLLPSSFLNPTGEPLPAPQETPAPARKPPRSNLSIVARAPIDALETAAAVPGIVGDAAAKAYSESSVYNPLGFLNPFGGGGLPSFPKMPDLDKAGNDLNKLANKALLGELILVGGVVAIAGIAAWAISRKPDAVSSDSLVKLLRKGAGV